MSSVINCLGLIEIVLHLPLPVLPIVSHGNVDERCRCQCHNLNVKCQFTGEITENPLLIEDEKKQFRCHRTEANG